MILYIVRHAWAGQHGDPEYPNDDLRPLTKQGQKRFRRVAERLAKRGIAPMQIASSPLLRCKQTAEVLADRLPVHPPLTLLEELAPGAQLEELLPWTRQHGGADLAWVGHAPDVEHLVADLIGTGTRIDFAKGAVAAISFEAGIEAGAGRLLWLATAEIVGV